MKIYELYPTFGGFSNKTEDYDGKSLTIAAESIKQAYYFAYNHKWSTGPGSPGIVEHYQRNGPEQGWHRLWDGCQIHGGLAVEHGDGVRKIKVAMDEHLSTH